MKVRVLHDVALCPCVSRPHSLPRVWSMMWHCVAVSVQHTLSSSAADLWCDTVSLCQYNNSNLAARLFFSDCSWSQSHYDTCNDTLIAAAFCTLNVCVCMYVRTVCCGDCMQCVLRTALHTVYAVQYAVRTRTVYAVQYAVCTRTVHAVQYAVRTRTVYAVQYAVRTRTVYAVQ
jgi:hypothetical protein